MLPTPIIPTLSDSVYEPAEDSFLLLDCLELCILDLQLQKYPIVCEIGSGSGVVSTFLKAYVFPHGVFLATDVNPNACEAILATVKVNCSQQKFDTFDALQMSLTTGIRRNLVDILVFNPPYVPADNVPTLPTTPDDYSWLDLALLGGEDGMEVTWLVLLNLDYILSEFGVAYILFCARNNPDQVVKVMEERGWAVRVVEKRKAGWEVLSVIEFKRKSL